MLFTSTHDQFQITINAFPTDGFQLSLSEWDGNDFMTIVDKRYIGYTIYEAVISAMVEAQISERNAYVLADQMGIAQTIEEEDEVLA